MLVQDFALYLGETNGLIQSLSGDVQDDVFAHIMLSEALKTSEIEGEYFSREDVMSSLKINLGLGSYLLPSKNKKADAIARLMIEVRKSYQRPLTLQLLLEWHRILMEKEPGISAGQLRRGTEPMQVISGHYGKIQVHYEAPPSENLPVLMDNFIQWYNGFEETELGVMGSAMALSALSHLYFETLHPFEDGNGRIGRALAEKALAERLKMPVFISLSNAIEKNKKTYYDEIKKAQRSLDVSGWLFYFCNILLEAQKESRQTVEFTLKKTQYFDKFKSLLNEREVKAISKMLEQGTNGFQGGMTARKYMSINKTTKATATRDLQHLVEISALIRKGAGRSVAYELNISF